MNETVRLTLTVAQVLCSVILIVIVMLQSGKSAGLSGAISGGGGDTFLAKNQSKTLDAKLAKLTKWVAFSFMLLTIALSVS